MKKIIAFLIAFFLLGNISVFSDEEKITRIEFIAYVMSDVGLVSSNQLPGFSDISVNERYYNYVAAAKENNIVTGYEDNTLKPYEKITRQDAVVILSRTYRLKPVSGVYISGFSDYDKIHDYSVEYISAAARNGIIDYKPGMAFRPQENVTIEEMMDLIESFKEHLNSTMNFSVGYPKISKERIYNAISVSIKTSKPCTVYYKLLPTDKYLNSYKPKAEEITDFLTAVNIADSEINVNIYPDSSKEYNLYLVGIDTDGEYTEVESIRDVAKHRFNIGDGTKTNPYLIYNEEQLEGIKYHPNAFYRLENDIEIKGDWKPIRIEHNGYVGFSGVLDGNFHKITGFEITSYERDVGLFSAVYGGTIKNLYADGAVSGNGNVGIIAGVSEGGTISQCFVTGRVDATGNNAGGIVGSNNGAIENSVSAAYFVEASNYAGGIAGTNRGDITKCLSAAYSVTADMYASGVSGANIGGNVDYNVCANIYANDVITTNTGRVTTNKQFGTTVGNYCYDKMMADTSVNFGFESQDGLEATWENLTSVDFYTDIMGWNTKNIWTNNISEDFRLLSLRGFESVDMIKGITVYAPIKIYTESDLMKVYEHPDYHYIMMNNITVNDEIEWNPIGSDESEESGFNGTFDGNNYTISGLHMKQKDDVDVYGMFGVITAGTVRNLKLINIAIEGHSLVGGLAGINHGYIENCSIDGRIYALRKENMLSVGGVVGNNFGIIEKVSADVKIRASGEVLTAGGIVANNDGFIDSVDYKGEIKAEQKTMNSNAVAGGVVGINTAGFIYNCYSDADIDSKASTSYIGGISGIVNGGEVYKVSSEGQLNINSNTANDSSAYVGGIAGLTPEGLVMNSFSYSTIFIDANKVYAGGIVGYNQQATIQNTYSMSMLDSVSGIYDDSLGYTAGICGLSEGGFISDNVALNNIIKTNSFADKICNAQSEMVSCINNYVRDDILVYGKEEYAESGEKISVKKTDMKEFFFASIMDGGKLGWIEGDVWYIDNDYEYPLLNGVKKQDNFKRR